jgi:hypothetical protein
VSSVPNAYMTSFMQFGCRSSPRSTSPIMIPAFDNVS